MSSSFGAGDIPLRNAALWKRALSALYRDDTEAEFSSYLEITAFLLDDLFVISLVAEGLTGSPIVYTSDKFLQYTLRILQVCTIFLLALFLRNQRGSQVQRQKKDTAGLTTTASPNSYFSLLIRVFVLLQGTTVIGMVANPSFHYMYCSGVHCGDSASLSASGILACVVQGPLALFFGILSPIVNSKVMPGFRTSPAARSTARYEALFYLLRVGMFAVHQTTLSSPSVIHGVDIGVVLFMFLCSVRYQSFYLPIFNRIRAAFMAAAFCGSLVLNVYNGDDATARLVSFVCCMAGGFPIGYFSSMFAERMLRSMFLKRLQEGLDLHHQFKEEYAVGSVLTRGNEGTQIPSGLQLQIFQSWHDIEFTARHLIPRAAGPGLNRDEVTLLKQLFETGLSQFDASSGKGIG
ncbi:hypothetical protein BJ742DRAFT_766764 [Cladochytrium replicatum]|nr:hypothetical protein BJ742DRAFT_766764 [Cladochytrium replicatum]